MAKGKNYLKISIEDLKNDTKNEFVNIYEHFGPIFKALLWRQYKILADDFYDIWQEVMLKLWVQRAKINDASHLWFWLYQNVTRKAIDFLRSPAQKRKVSLDDLKIDSSLLARRCQIDVGLQDSDFILLKFIDDSLTDEERYLLYLKFIAGFTLEEIAEILGIPISTLKAKYSRLIKKIKMLLQRWDK